MSSVAYATEASLFTLLGVGTLAFGWLLPISFAIVGRARARDVLLSADDPGVSERRRQLHRRPRQPRRPAGPGRGCGPADRLRPHRRRQRLVGVSSALLALPAAASGLPCPLIVLSILLVMAVNLRGIRESGTIFAAPTYIFLGSVSS